ncbi:MAG: lectin like domain-containing protein [Cloacibacillus sp.]
MKNFVRAFAFFVFVTALAPLAAQEALASSPLKAQEPSAAFTKWNGAVHSKASARAKPLSKATDYGYAPSPVNWSHLDNVAYGIGGAASLKRAATLPSSYDLRERMPAVRNQYPFGNCWTHSAMSATESNLITKGLANSQDVFLSEWYLTYFGYNPTSVFPSFTNSSGAPYHSAGADDWRAVALLSRGTGAVSEALCPTPKELSEVYVPAEMNRGYKLLNALYLGNLMKTEVSVVLTPGRKEMLKEALMRYGALSVGLLYEDSAYDKKTCAFYSGAPYSKTNHAVTVVGWDDEYSFDAASLDKKPEKPGAWIVRNSWGADWGLDGYFYVSYEEPSLCDGVVYDTAPALSKENIYQYDPLGTVGFVGYGDKASFANMFTAKGNEAVTSVAFYTSAPDQKCTIQIYTRCAASPVDGKLAATQTLSIGAPGYHTVALDTPVRVAKGSKFSIVVHTSSDKTPYLIPAEYVLENYSESAAANAGEGWISPDGEIFDDILSDDGMGADSKASVCLKAFTVDDPESSGGCSAGAYGLILFAAAVPFVGRRGRSRPIK